MAVLPAYADYMEMEQMGLAEEFFIEGWIAGWAEGWVEGWAEGLIEGRQDEAKNIAVRLFKTGTMTLHQIAEVVPRLSVEELKKMQAEVSPTT